MVDQAHAQTGLAILRSAVGGVLLAQPGLATSGDPDRRVLVRTIGIRDLVLGAGAVMARAGSTDTARDWARIGLASDVGDVLLALASRHELGRRGTLIAALTPVPFVVVGVWSVLGASRTGTTRPGT